MDSEGSVEGTKYPQAFIDLIKTITNKRANVVLKYIMDKGFITTEELANEGYEHAPRAARDVREYGIPLETFKVKSTAGKSIAAYKFGDLTRLESYKAIGRTNIPKDFKSQLYALCNGRCAICNTEYEERYLQVDHRVPYQIGGDSGTKRVLSEYMLLCGSCNRAKSWSCEHCKNWLELKEPKLCLRCYWGSPENYNHIALEQMRRLDVTWVGNEVHYYDAIKEMAEKEGIMLPDFIKDLINKRREAQ